MDRLYTILHLSLLDNVGPKVINTIIQRKPQVVSWNDLYHISLSEWRSFFGLSEVMAQKIHAGLCDKSLVEKELELVHAYNVHLVTCLDENYPSLLKEINVPPPLLYYRGTLPAQTASLLAVVGSRKMNFYGDQVIKKIVPDIVASDVVIVSGGAIGVDRAAHECAMRNGGSTVAVLGSGLIEPYPKSNVKLFEEVIACGGAVVSCFSMETKAFPSNFPQRNRIIAGLSHGCLVVQAARKSGALITARYALDQGREVCAVPGPIENLLTVGCHMLIQQGAALTMTADDVLSLLSLPVQSQGEKNAAIAAQAQLDRQMTLQEQAVYTSCAAPSTVDDVVQLTGYSFIKVQELLAQLQLDGHITQNFAGFWQQV